MLDYAADVKTIMDDTQEASEEVIYLPLNGEPRTINVIVDRNPATGVDGIDGFNERDVVVWAAKPDQSRARA